MKKAIFLIAAILAGVFIGRAQTTTSSPSQISGAVNPGPHTSCTVTANTTQICFASDGLWFSANGSAYVQVASVGGTTGIQSISVNGGTPCTGPACSITVPTKAISSTTATTTTTIQ